MPKATFGKCNGSVGTFLSTFCWQAQSNKANFIILHLSEAMVIFCIEWRISADTWTTLIMKLMQNIKTKWFIPLCWSSLRMHSSMSIAYSHLSSKVGLRVLECPKILASAGMVKIKMLTLTLFLDPDNCGAIPALYLVIGTSSLKVSISKNVVAIWN